MADIISLIQNHADLLTTMFTHLASQERAQYVTVSHQWYKHLVLATNIVEIAPTWDEHFLAGHYHTIIRGKPTSSDVSNKLCAGIICRHSWQLFLIWYKLIKNKSWRDANFDVRYTHNSLMDYCSIYCGLFDKLCINEGWCPAYFT
jgi:hypothetical protein